MSNRDYTLRSSCSLMVPEADLFPSSLLRRFDPMARVTHTALHSGRASNEPVQGHEGALRQVKSRPRAHTSRKGMNGDGC